MSNEYEPMTRERGIAISRELRQMREHVNAIREEIMQCKTQRDRLEWELECYHRLMGANLARFAALSEAITSAFIAIEVWLDINNEAEGDNPND
jgi:hypothetical protein